MCVNAYSVHVVANSWHVLTFIWTSSYFVPNPKHHTCMYSWWDVLDNTWCTCSLAPGLPLLVLTLVNMSALSNFLYFVPLAQASERLKSGQRHAVVARNEYLLCLATANGHLQKHFETDLPSVMKVKIFVVIHFKHARMSYNIIWYYLNVEKFQITEFIWNLFTQ